MAGGNCSRCFQLLTENNSFPTIFKLGYGYCRSCHKNWCSEWRDKNPVKVVETRKKFNRSFKSRYGLLRRMMLIDKVPENDLLWNSNFYIGFISGAVCHYCLGSLGKTGAGVDRIVNGLGHVCYNIVPCCGFCNRLKGKYITYEEMLLLFAPVLREIRKRREVSRCQLIPFPETSLASEANELQSYYSP